jgi:sterol 3beta-glucosyltransferase
MGEQESSKAISRRRMDLKESLPDRDDAKKRENLRTFWAKKSRQLSNLRPATIRRVPGELNLIEDVVEVQAPSRIDDEFSLVNLLEPRNLPRLNICILVCGTRGDVQPFLALGHRLLEDGHRVRLATHQEYGSYVKESGLEFYPLAGDPKLLSSFMVETSGRLMPNLLNEKERRTLPIKMQQVEDIIASTWPACTEPSPQDDERRPFLADCIISNPVVYSHVHLAEALGAHLHLMFPQPWIPTMEFPHPFSQLSYGKGPQIENWYSYVAVDWLMSRGTRSALNRLRRSLGLEANRLGERDFMITVDNSIPFAKMWSPSLLPKPQDWGQQVDVVGNIFIKKKDMEKLRDFQPSPDLSAFLDAGDPPIFVGFGSMVIADTSKLTDIIIEAAAITGKRVLIQSSWSNMEAGDTPNYVFNLGACPHDWLLPKMAAVVHHGGAGTTAAGLRFGKPTLICPFFGDQFLWGEAVHQRGAGPRPIPISLLTSSQLAECFELMTSPDMITAAEALAVAFAREDGLENTATAFYKQMPKENMVCHVSLWMDDRPLLARKHCRKCNMIMSMEADRFVHGAGTGRELHIRKNYSYVRWGVYGPPNPVMGLWEGLGSFFHEAAGGLKDLGRKPYKGAKQEGVTGFGKGLCSGILSFGLRPVQGVLIFADKVFTGTITNPLRPLSKVSGRKYASRPRGPRMRRYSLWGKFSQYKRSSKRDTKVGFTTDMTVAYEKAVTARKMFDGITASTTTLMAAPKSAVIGLLQDEADALGVPLTMTEIKAQISKATPDAKLISFVDFCVFLRRLESADEKGEPLA